MSFNEKVAVLVQRIPTVINHLETEEATKNALIMPFIAALGYDIFNPQEVLPEFIADVGLKRGEKVDYAIKKDGEVIILIECKKAKTDLSQTEMSQLFRYFSVTKARIAILTNGIKYWFYSDLVESNKMDERPFLELDLSDPKKHVLSQVRQLAKEEFDLDKMLTVANELKFVGEFQRVFAAQLERPDDDFVRFFYSKTNPGCRFTGTVREQLNPLISKAFNQLISDRIADRLRSALNSESEEAKKTESDISEQQSADFSCREGVVTTEEELDGFKIVKAILCRSVPLDRIHHRDTKSYFGILLDDNNRKPICRLWFNGKQKYLGLFNEQREEERVPVEGVEDIYLYADRLVATAGNYDSK